MKLVIVESPAKARTISKYLGTGYNVLASYGHIRDLPSKDGSVDPENDFAMVWQADSTARNRIREIGAAAKSADGLILATDPDREGEAIAWHILEELRKRRIVRKDYPVERVVFNAITKSSVSRAIAQPRQLDQELVDAYLARRALDYLVGFNLSPVLWRKLPGSRSAGRVQSVALRLVCQRELEIETFKSREYWSIAANLRAPDGTIFEARLHALNGKKLDKYALPDAESAQEALDIVRTGDYRVANLDLKPVKRNPPPPFITSTLQQDASRKLGLSAKQTMYVAQKLYEAGHITYMRTDGVNMTDEAYTAARTYIESNYGRQYLPEKPRYYSSRQKNAQEAHEAIRPTDFSVHPDTLPVSEKDSRGLYTLIWRRAVASQMETARFERTTIDLLSKNKKASLRASGEVLVFDGFIKLYGQSREDTGSDEKQDKKKPDGNLPKMHEGTPADLIEAKPDQHFTAPPPRFTEASLVKELEERGIGRPSTYASTMSTLVDRDYVRIEKKQLVPEDKGRLVTAFLEKFFGKYIEYDYTANLEERLDVISDGKLAWKVFLHQFWHEFYATIEETQGLRITNVLEALNVTLGHHLFPETDDDGNKKDNPRLCPLCKTGQLSLKLGRYGAFVGCSDHPACKFTRALTGDKTENSKAGLENRTFGLHPQTGQSIVLKTGRFGPYLEMEQADDDKPKRSSLPKGWNADSLTEKQAVQLIDLPREIGLHPEDGQPVLAGLGRYGPYIQHLKTYANVETAEDMLEIGLNRAIALLADKRASSGQRKSAKPLRELGQHPDDSKIIAVYEGRYGFYVKHDKLNASLPKTATPDSITLEQAVNLLADRANKKSGRRKKS